MRRILFFAALLCGSNLAAQNSDPSTWKPGQVLSEKSTDLGKGYREVARSQVNPPEHWEGVGHFTFVYYQDLKLCQCGKSEFFISPSGNHALFINERPGSVTLFTAQSKMTKTVTPGFVALISKVEWNEFNGEALVVFQRRAANESIPKPISVSLKNGT